MKYTEDDLRKAYEQGAKDYCRSSKTLTEFLSYDVDEYIDIISSLIVSVEEDKISFTYSFLRRKIDWEQFCDLTGIDYYAKANGYEVKDDEVFYIAESKAKQLNLI